MRSSGTPRRSEFNRLILAVLALSTLAAGVSPARALQHSDRHRAKQQIVALEEQWRNALLTCDAASMDRLLSDDYVGISMGGQVNTKSQQLERLRRHEIAMHSIRLTEVKVKLIGRDVAVVTSKASVEGTNEGRNISGQFRYTRVYQHLPSGVWKITNFEVTRIPKPFHPQISDGKVIQGCNHSSAETWLDPGGTRPQLPLRLTGPGVLEQFS